jgi:hypothetical protein
MSQIYEGSHVTLSATKSANAHEGCFVSPERGQTSEIFEFGNKIEGMYTIRCREYDSLNIRESKTPLESRGWTLQERLLSKRIIHFMDQNLEWECNHRGRGNARASFFPPLLRFSLLCTQDHASRERIERYWKTIVSDFTRRSLTYPDDIFPALQGLAKLVPRTMGRYLAGLWENSLPTGLCWYASPCERLADWRAPTWSWASASGQVGWLLGADMVAQVTVVNVTVTPQGTDPTGPLSHGELVIRGQCLIGTIVRYIVPWEYNGHHHDGDDVWIESTSIAKVLLDQTDDKGHDVTYSVHWDRIQRRERNAQVIVLQLGESDEKTPEDEEEERKRGVVLKRRTALVLQAVQAEERVYERLGLIQTHDGPHPWVELFYGTAAEEIELTII